MLAGGPGSSAPFTTYLSVDDGVTWQILPTKVFVPVVEDATGRLIQAGFRGRISVSTDEGSTWTDVVTVGLEDLDFSGPIGVDGAGRLYGELVPVALSAFLRPLAPYVSLDGGLTWTPTPLHNPNVNTFATDRQGHLLAATAGGLFRLESPDDPGPAPPAMP